MDTTMRYVLKPATEEDLPFLKELFTEARGIEFQMLPAAMVEQLMDMQFRAQRMSYAAQYPAAVDEIVWVDGERAGRLLVDTAEAMWLVDVALLGRYRRRGVGTALIKELCERAEQMGLPLWLSVRAGNPAARLYERLGFVAVGSDEANTRMVWRRGAEEADGDAEERLPSEPGGAVEQDYTRAYFATLVGQTIKVRTMEAPGRAAREGVALVVDSVQALEAGGKVTVGDSFVVGLHGEVSELVPAETVEIEPPGGAAMVLFLAPLGPEDGRMRYEAIFNRVKPA